MTLARPKVIVVAHNHLLSWPLAEGVTQTGSTFGPEQVKNGQKFLTA